MLKFFAVARPLPVRALSNPYIPSTLSALAVLALLSVLSVPSHAGPADTVWTRLFNGTDLKDWDIKTMGLPLNQDPRNTYRVVDGAIEVNYSNYPNWSGEPWSHLGYKVRPFSYYLVRLEYQFYGKQVGGAPGYANENSGIMIHSQSLATMALNQNWPISLEVQFIGPNSSEGVGSGNLCTPGTAVELPKGTFNDDHCIRAAANVRTLAPAWTRASALVLGDSLVRQMIEDKPVLTYYRPMEQQGIVSGNSRPIVNRRPLGTGYILLQSESAPIRFRNIEVADLAGCMDPKSPRYKSYYVRNDSADCKVTALRGAGAPGTPGLAIDAAGRTLAVAVPGRHTVRISDLEGRMLWSRRGSGSVSYDLETLRFGGVCLLTVDHAGGTFTQKLYLDR